ncbi:hypothetical protein [uncultured Enterovirga sp.]|uniref:hypothetical protein n=1 Tax=uncultured Enterovirga sp. TaxID=2026352 RepID=UPI0035CA2021
MPHLDANALLTDAEGMDFLRDVLEVPAAAPLNWKAFEVRPSGSAHSMGFEPQPARLREFCWEHEAA